MFFGFEKKWDFTLWTNQTAGYRTFENYPSFFVSCPVCLPLPPFHCSKSSLIPSCAYNTWTNICSHTHGHTYANTHSLPVHPCLVCHCPPHCQLVWGIMDGIGFYWSIGKEEENGGSLPQLPFWPDHLVLLAWPPQLCFCLGTTDLGSSAVQWPFAA
jgi:hypothetical protein